MSHTDPRYVTPLMRAEMRPQCKLPLSHQLLDHADYMDEQLAAAEAQVKELAGLAQEMAGYVASFDLSDEGPNSEWDRWKRCRDRINALARTYIESNTQEERCAHLLVRSSKGSPPQ